MITKFRQNVQNTLVKDIVCQYDKSPPAQARITKFEPEISHEYLDCSTGLTVSRTPSSALGLGTSMADTGIAGTSHSIR